MHSVLYRLNTLITLAGFLLAVMCSLASFTDTFHVPSVTAHAEVLKVNRFRKQLTGNDEVSLTLNVSMNLRSTFTWNTKQVFVFVAAEYETAKNSLNQVSLWDHIIQDKGHAKLEAQITNKYPFIDQFGKSANTNMYSAKPYMWEAIFVVRRSNLFSTGILCPRQVKQLKTRW
uniref:Signal peptidase complex subunit 3 n=1 Tax=Nelumbo nucifera TaxID=4432 RepID=A0A822YLA2_NELNU|nr:TPA_asm: hypothetical protein HUJ06_010616 [Nelumbo nucifera]